MSSRFLAVLALTFSLSSLSYGQIESNFFQQNQILFNPAALSSDTDIEGLAGAKTSSYEFLRRPYLLYNAAAARVKRFTVVGSSDFLWDATTTSGNISVSAGYNLIKKDNLSLSAAIGANYHWWKFSEVFFNSLDIVSQQDPVMQYYTSGGSWEYLGLKGGVFVETENVQLGAAAYIHELSNEVVFHGHYKIDLNETWTLVPAARVQGYRSTRQFEDRTRDWAVDFQNAVVYKDKISGILGYRSMYTTHTMIIGANYRLNDMLSFGYAFDTYKRRYIFGMNGGRINAHELLIKVNFRK